MNVSFNANARNIIIFCLKARKRQLISVENVQFTYRMAPIRAINVRLFLAFPLQNSCHSDESVSLAG